MCGRCTRLAYGAVTIRFAFTTVKAVLDFGVRQGVVASNQARLLPGRDRPRVSKRKTRPLSPLEISRLLQAAREPYRTIFAIGIFAGLRSGEIRGSSGVTSTSTTTGSTSVGRPSSTSSCLQKP